MITANNIIITDIDPKKIRAEHRSILVRDGEFDVTATTEIFDEGYDPGTKKFFLKLGLYYPRRSTRTTISLAMQATKDGKTVAVAPPQHIMTQEEFDTAIVKGEKITVPTVN